MNVRAPEAGLPRFASVEQVIEKMKPGDTLYALKANPHPHVLDQVWASGIRHFDTASLQEIELVRGRFPDAICHFMAPVRPAGTAKIAFEKYGITDYVVDCDFELDKLLAETRNPKKLRIFVRVSARSLSSSKSQSTT